MFSNPKPSRLTLLLIGILFIVACLFFWVFRELSIRPDLGETTFGITFSSLYTAQLGLNVKETYQALVNELDVRTVRLPVYWSQIEQESGRFDWEEMDWLIDYSKEHEVALTLVVGAKVPRWPECFIPDWAEKLSSADRQKAVLSFIEATVNRYKTASVIERWQVENEPFFPFGECPKLSPKEFLERVDTVRRLDSSRPIQITVSGELGVWETEAEAADILGISMYRLTWNDVFGYFIYPLTPSYYYLRAQLVKDEVDQVIVSELQAEPWFFDPIDSRPRIQWYSAFTEEMFQNNLQFAKDAHLPEAYLWGAEWWYALKKEGDERLWNVAKSVFDEK